MTYSGLAFGGPPFYGLGEVVAHGLTGKTEMCADFVRSALVSMGVLRAVRSAGSVRWVSTTLNIVFLKTRKSCIRYP